jgi:hypothetical protein
VRAVCWRVLEFIKAGGNMPMFETGLQQNVLALNSMGAAVY